MKPRNPNLKQKEKETFNLIQVTVNSDDYELLREVGGQAVGLFVRTAAIEAALKAKKNKGKKHA